MGTMQLMAGVLLLAILPLAGMARPTGEEIDKYGRHGGRAGRVAASPSDAPHRISPRLARRLWSRIRSWDPDHRAKFGADEALPPFELPPWDYQGLPSKGTIRMFVLPIAFSDYPPNNSTEELENRIFGSGVSGNFPYENLRNYYLRSSYNQLNLIGEVLDWYETPYPRSQVTRPSDLIIEALEYHLGHGHNFAQYDNDREGTIDYFVVFWTGPYGGNQSFEWRDGYSGMNTGYAIDGKSPRGYAWLRLVDTLAGAFDSRVLIHETGHALGLPDYYDMSPTIGPRGGLGGIDPMDAALGDHNCFSKFLLEWIDPQVVSGGNHIITLRPSSGARDAVIFWPEAVPGETFYEFFMVQNRDRAGNDTDLPGKGLLVWHVDARLSGGTFLKNNSLSDHKLLRLMEADGLEQIESRSSNAHAADYYVPGKALTPSSVPNSNAYDGTPTQAYLYGIEPASQAISFRIQIGGGAILNTLAISAGSGGTTRPAPGVYYHESGRAVQVTALPHPGYELFNWSGSLSGTANPITVVLDGDKTLSALFRKIGSPQMPVLTIEAPENGTVTPPPGAYPHPTGSRVTVTASPHPGCLFSGWSGDVQGDSNPLILAMERSLTIKPLFRAIRPPAGFNGRRVINRSLLQAETIDELTWATNPENGGLDIVAYRLFLVSETPALLAEIPASQFTFRRRKVSLVPQTYAIAAVVAGGREGFRSQVTLQ